MVYIILLVDMLQLMYKFYGDPTGIGFIPLRIYHNELSNGISSPC
jgi:hypothetical protein